LFKQKQQQNKTNSNNKPPAQTEHCSCSSLLPHSGKHPQRVSHRFRLHSKAGAPLSSWAQLQGYAGVTQCVAAHRVYEIVTC